MLDSLDIRGYRGFTNFHISKLGRINLLVGGNNSGKTTVLEAVELLSSGPSLAPLWAIGQRRGEIQSTVGNTGGQPRERVMTV